MTYRISCLFGALLFLGLFGGPSPCYSETRGGQAMNLEVKSTAFQEGAMIPKLYTCDGQDISPPLSWSGVPAFSWRKDDHKIAFWPDRIAVDQLESREQAKVVMEELVKLVNDVWEGRGQIVPESTSRENLQPLELYRLLPRTNCKKCGEASCFNFALKLAAGQIELEKCEPLFVEVEYREQRAQIESLLAAKRPLL